MANVYHLSSRETTGQDRLWTVRAELWQSAADQTQRISTIADLAFHLEGTGRPAPGIAGFFPFALLAAMRAGLPLIVDGLLPADWKCSCQRFQELASSWFSSLTPVGVEARWEGQSVAPSQMGHGVVFSSDLDSFHALHSSAPTHLVHLGKKGVGDELRLAARAVAAHMDLPLISVDAEIRSDLPGMIDPADFPAVHVAAALNVLAGQLSQLTWGSPRGWLSPPGGGDHFALAECFLAQNTGLRLTGRGTTRMEKWRAVEDMPLAREFLRVGASQPCGPTNGGECLDPSKLDHWARDLATMGAQATTTPIWPKLSRRLLPQVLATAASGDPAWLRSVAGLHGARTRSPDE